MADAAQKFEGIDQPGRQYSQKNEVRELQEENIKALPQVGNKQALEQAIFAADDMKKQETIQKYLQATDGFQMQADFFQALPPKYESEAEKFFANPDINGVQAVKTTRKKQEERIKQWERRTGEKFTGETTAELGKFVGDFYEGRVMAFTPAPGKDLFAKIGKSKEGYRFTEAETEKNLKWKQKLLQNNANPLEFMDWLDQNFRGVLEKRDEEIQDWADNNVKYAEKHPELFSPKYLEKLKEISKNLKAGKPNQYPIELLRDFEKLVVPEQKEKRIALEKEAAKEYDKHKKLLGPKKLLEWKQKLKKDPIDKLTKWIKGEDGDRALFNERITQYQENEKEFLTKLEDYPAEKNKEGYKEWYYSLDPDERDEPFDFLTAQFEKVEATQKESSILMTKKGDLLTNDEMDHLRKIEELSQTEQAELVEDITRNSEKRSHLLAKFTNRKQNFDTAIAEFEAGTSMQELDEITKPITDIYENLKDEPCSAVFDALQDCELIDAKYKDPTKVEVAVSEQDIIDMFLEDHAVSNILLAQTWEEKHEQAHSQKEIVDKELERSAEAAEEGTEGVYSEAMQEYVQEKAEDSDFEIPEAANDNEAMYAANDNEEYSEEVVNERVNEMETNIAQGSDYFKNAMHEDTSFKEKYAEQQEKEKQNILASNDNLKNAVYETKSKITINLDDQAIKMTQKTSADLAAAMRDDPSRINMVDNAKKEVSDRSKKKQKVTGWLKRGVTKIFGAKEAAKVDTNDVFDSIRNARSQLSEGDNAATMKTKLAKEMAKNSNVKKLKKKAA